jgi:DNA end-binding protein Ku
MPASVFNGSISFGLVSVPITVLSATEDHSVRFRRIHTADRGRVRNRYWCEVEDREVTFGEIGRGYELPGGRVIPITDEELRALPLPTARAIELIAFIPAAAVDPLRIGPGYYLQPQGAVAAKPYLVLRHALERASRVAVARFAWQGRERLGLLRARGDVIALHGLLWPDEIRDPAAVVPPPVQLDEDEIGEAVALIEAMTRDDLTGPEFTDHYSEALHEVIEAKREDRQMPQAPEPEARPGQLVDLMAALQESVDKARAARGETGDADQQEAPAIPAKKAAVRKTPGKATARAASSRNAGRSGDQRGTPAR